MSNLVKKKLNSVLYKMQKTLLVILTVISLVTGRAINSAGLNLIKTSEGFRPNFYGDPVVSLNLIIPIVLTNIKLYFYLLGDQNHRIRSRVSGNRLQRNQSPLN